MLTREQHEAIYRMALQQQYADLSDYLDSITVPGKSRSQRLRETGFTRRPTWRSLPKDGDAETDKETGHDNGR